MKIWNRIVVNSSEPNIITAHYINRHPKIRCTKASSCPPATSRKYYGLCQRRWRRSQLPQHIATSIRTHPIWESWWKGCTWNCCQQKRKVPVAQCYGKLFNYFGIKNEHLKLKTNWFSEQKSNRLADRLVFWVLQGKTVDEIYLEEKARNSTKPNATKRLSGYINRDEYLRMEAANKLNSSVNSLANDHLMVSNENENDRKPLTNSSSKSNVGTNALRENHDSKSAQKSTTNVSFSGRNQKNLSPYNDKSRSVTNLNKPNKLMPGTNSNILKVKRQISFDNWKHVQRKT